MNQAANRVGRGVVLALLGLAASGCSILDGWTENKYQTHFIWDIDPEEKPPVKVKQPDIHRTSMTHHEAAVNRLVFNEHLVIGSAEFHTANSPGGTHLARQARAVGAQVVVASSKFIRKDQELVNRREYIPGESYTVNGTTIQTRGRWINQVEVVTQYYHDYKATFLRHKSEAVILP